MNWIKEHKVTVFVIILFVGIVLSPLVLHNQTYPMVSGDTEHHIDNIFQMQNGENVYLYAGELIIGKIVILIDKVTDKGLMDSFLFINYLALAGIVLTLVLVAGKLVNKKAGLLVIPVALFCTQSILKLFAWGTIFSIINMYIILPIALFMLVRWFIKKQKMYLIASFVMFGLFGAFHPTAIYVPLAFAIFFPAYMFVKRNDGRRELLKIGALGVGIITIVLVSAYFAQPVITGIVSHSVAIVTTGSSDVAYPVITFMNFIFSFVTMATLGILIISIAGIIQYRKEMKMTNGTQTFLWIIACFIPPMAIMAFTEVMVAPARSCADMSTMIAIIAACLAGILLTHKKSMMLTGIILLLVGIGMVPTLATWFGLVGEI